MGDLNDFIAEADRTSKFIKFTDGEPVTGIYKGAKLIKDSFNPDQETMEYILEVDGVEKTFNSKSVKLARQVAELKKDDKVEFVKTGLGFETNWYASKKK